MSQQMDPNFYTDGAKKMVAEGMEAVSKILAYMKANDGKLNELSANERKQNILEFEPAKLFNQVHPIVFQYLAVEGVFSPNAFRRYVLSVFGKPKSKEDEEEMRKGTKYVYHFKNRQQALYYKYLLIESNPNIDKNKIHSMYEEVVDSLNADTDRMLDAYSKAQEDAKIVEETLTNEKRQELVNLLKKQILKSNH